MMYLNYPIFYLVKDDFDSDGNLINKNIPTEVPVVMMIQTTSCGWCTKAKPAYQKLADDHGYKINIDQTKNNKNTGNELAFFTTLQPGGKVKGEKELQYLIPKIDKSFRGFPHYMVYYKGKRIPYEGNRSYEDLKNFLEKL